MRLGSGRVPTRWGETPVLVVRCFADDREALSAVHRVPVTHRIRARATNLAEHSFEEERRRTKVIPGLMTEKATMKLAFATMTRAAQPRDIGTLAEDVLGHSPPAKRSAPLERSRTLRHESGPDSEGGA